MQLVENMKGQRARLCTIIHLNKKVVKMVHDYLFDIHIEEVLEKNDLSFFFSEEGVHKHAVIAIEYNEGQTPPCLSLLFCKKTRINA